MEIDFEKIISMKMYIFLIDVIDRFYSICPILYIYKTKQYNKNKDFRVTLFIFKALFLQAPCQSFLL
jgi:hypothetical protein